MEFLFKCFFSQLHLYLRLIAKKKAIVYHECYYNLSWMILLKKRELLCVLFSILQATFIFKPWRRQETTSAKNVRTLLQKEFFQTKTKNCYDIGIYQTRIRNLIETMTVVFHPSSRSKGGTEEEKSSWACVQDVSQTTAE